MAKNPFKQTPPPNDVKRNAFDLSFTNNLTLKIGQLVPVMCKEVVPGDSFEIDTNFGLRFMPTIFPVQTKMRADVHFFYVRTRNLWKNWKKFIGDTPNVNIETGVKRNIVHPYIGAKSSDSDFYAEGSLADYLGIPTDYVSSENMYQLTAPLAYMPSSGLEYGPNTSSIFPLSGDYANMLQYCRYIHPSSQLGAPIQFRDPIEFGGNVSVITNHRLNGELVDFNVKVTQPFEGSLLQAVYLIEYREGAWRIVARTSDIVTIEGNPLSFENTDSVRWLTKQGVKSGSEVFSVVNYEDVTLAYTLKTEFSFSDVLKGNIDFPLTPWADFMTEIHTDTYSVTYNQAFQVYNPNVCKISALPFRAYDSIYNSHYRNWRIAPLEKDGEYVYDEFVRNDSDGEDNIDYRLYNRYWEKDFLTTAVPSPQQGLAPLVGLNTNTPYTTQQMIIDGNPADIQVQSAQDGKVIGVSYYGENVPVGSVEALEQAIEYGISINDFRNVNALQKWLEINQRRGYLYKEQLLSHFGVDVKFEELQMPEFIGGVSQRIETQAIYNNNAQGSKPLGDYAGAAGCWGSGDNKIHKYCDEHGFIIAIMSIVPIPSYSQLLPKVFTKDKHLDYFFPEFGHIGMQPITYKEVTPLQVGMETPAQLNDTFGYQRAYYDYIANWDEVHGNFRSSLRNYLVNREFVGKPLLSEQFLKITPEEVNDIFAVTTDTDKIIGQVNFTIIAKRPIPFFGTPSLQ